MGCHESSQLIEDLLIHRKNLLKAVMAEGSEIDERVDLDDDNYMEETDEDVVDGIEDEPEEGLGDDKAEEQYEELRTDGSGKEQSSEPDRSPIGDEHGEDEEKFTASINEEDKEKHAELLSLPPYGAEVFIGGLPKDVIEEDLRDLCEPFGEIYEVSSIVPYPFYDFSIFILFPFLWFQRFHLLFFAFFHTIGDVQVKLIKNKDTGEFKGYAFVAFKTKEDAQKAIDELKNKEFKVISCHLIELSLFYLLLPSF